MRLSVLDLVPVRTDQSTSDALAASTQLAQTADRLGYTRYWVAEHHNMPSVAATSPPVLIAHLAANTSQIRLGSGGVMLPNHAPLAVAEQFALLEAAAPGPHRPRHRPGARLGPADVVSVAQRARDATTATSTSSREYLDHVVAMMSASGVRVTDPAAGHLHPQGDAGGDLRAADVAARLVDVLGASGRGQGAAVCVRAPLLRAGHRGGACRLPVGVPAQRPRRRTGDVPDRQRGGRRNPRRGNGFAAAEPADDGPAAHRSAARARSTSSRTPNRSG